MTRGETTPFFCHPELVEGRSLNDGNTPQAARILKLTHRHARTSTRSCFDKLMLRQAQHDKKKGPVVILSLSKDAA
jgi:hypothetical protein